MSKSLPGCDVGSFFSWVELLPTLYLRRKLAIFDSVDCALKWYILWSLGGRSKGRN